LKKIVAIAGLVFIISAVFTTGFITVLNTKYENNQIKAVEDHLAFIHWMENPRYPISLVRQGLKIFNNNCMICHGPGGSGGVFNPNYAKMTIPALNTLAEKMFIEEKEDGEEVIKILEAGQTLDSKGPLQKIKNYMLIAAQYDAIKKVIQNGSPAAKRDPAGLEPTSMPSWKNTLSDKHINGVIAYLLSISEFEEEDEDW